MAGVEEALVAPGSGGAEERPLIAVIEDDEATRVMYSILLDGAGYAVLAVQSGAETLARLRTGPTPAAILMDLGLPDTQGVPLCRVLRAHDRFRTVPIIAVTGWSSGTMVQGLGEAPFNDIFLKPVDPDVLLDAVRRYVPQPLAAAVPLGDVA